MGVAQGRQAGQRAVGRLVRGDGRGTGDAQGQRIIGGQSTIGRGVFIEDGRVDDPGDAVAVGMGLSRAGPGEVVCGAKPGQAVMDPGDGGLVQHAGQATRGVLDEMTVEWVGRRSGQAGQGDGGRIHAGVVEGGVPEDAGTVGHGAVKNVAREIVVAEEGGFPPHAHDQRAGMSCGMGGGQGDDVGSGARIAELRRQGEVGAAVHQVDVGVEKAGQDKPPARVDDACAGKPRAHVRAVPSARMRPALMATDSARGRTGSIVRMRAFRMTRSVMGRSRPVRCRANRRREGLRRGG